MFPVSWKAMLLLLSVTIVTDNLTEVRVLSALPLRSSPGLGVHEA